MPLLSTTAPFRRCTISPLAALPGSRTARSLGIRPYQSYWWRYRLEPLHRATIRSLYAPQSPICSSIQLHRLMQRKPAPYPPPYRASAPNFAVFEQFLPCLGCCRRRFQRRCPVRATQRAFVSSAETGTPLNRAKNREIWCGSPNLPIALPHHHPVVLNIRLLKHLPLFPKPVALVERHGPQLRI